MKEKIKDFFKCKKMENKLRKERESTLNEIEKKRKP